MALLRGRASGATIVTLVALCWFSGPQGLAEGYRKSTDLGSGLTQGTLQVSAGETPPVFNNSVCPSFWELQAPHVASTLKHEDYEGYFYELAFHDVTQYPLCPNKVPRCVSAEKKIETHPDGTVFVNDTWNLNCFGQPFPQELLFNLTEHTGFVKGYVPTTKIPFLPDSIVAGAVFPNTVVDFKAGPEGWLLEMQCVDAVLHNMIGIPIIAFVGINFYSKVDSEEAFQEILAAARARGLGQWIDTDNRLGVPGLSRVDNSGCPHRAIHEW